MKFKVKIDMIVERESIMTGYELKRKKWFPKYIVIRKNANNSESEQWQGFMKGINKNVDKSND